MKTPVRNLCLLVAVVLLSGCKGTGLHPVRGTVVDAKGVPAVGAIVLFHPKGELNSVEAIRPNGLVDENGVFTLSSQQRPGAPAGEYVVTIIWPAAAPVAQKEQGFRGGDANAPPDRLQGRYADQSNPRLTATVQPGTNELPPFVVK